MSRATREPGLIVVLRGRSARYGWVLLGGGLVMALMQGASEVALHGWYVVADRTSPMTEAAIWLQGHWALTFVTKLRVTDRAQAIVAAREAGLGR